MIGVKLLICFIFSFLQMSVKTNGLLTMLLGVVVIVLLVIFVMPRGGHNDMDMWQMHLQEHADMVTDEFSFLSLMIPHHQEAIETARVVVSEAENEEVIFIAEDIITAQEEEIALMEEWLATWYPERSYDDHGYMPMMRDLDEVSGMELERQWLEDMIMHHLGAVVMSEKLLTLDDIRDEVRELAIAIILTQNDEIDFMQALLESL